MKKSLIDWLIAIMFPGRGHGGLGRARPTREIHTEDIKIFRFFNMAAAAILDGRIHKISLADSGRMAQTHHFTKFRQNWSLHCGDVAIFWIFKMAAVRHLGFVWGIFGPPTVSIWGSLVIISVTDRTFVCCCCFYQCIVLYWPTVPSCSLHRCKWVFSKITNLLKLERRQKGEDSRPSNEHDFFQILVGKFTCWVKKCSCWETR